jgi:hypothetical protein
LILNLSLSLLAVGTIIGKTNCAVVFEQIQCQYQNIVANTSFWSAPFYMIPKYCGRFGHPKCTKVDLPRPQNLLLVVEKLHQADQDNSRVDATLSQTESESLAELVFTTSNVNNTIFVPPPRRRLGDNGNDDEWMGRRKCVCFFFLKKKQNCFLFIAAPETPYSAISFIIENDGPVAVSGKYFLKHIIYFF